jgi:hypothetical protein
MPISPPQRDQASRVIPHCHLGLANDHRVIRRISDEFVVKDNEGHPLRVSTAALEPSSVDVDPYCGLSVDLEPFILADGVDPKRHVTTPKYMASIVLAVGSFRSRNFCVGYDPLDDNPYHGGVWQDAQCNSKLTKGVRKALLCEAQWLVPVPGIPVFDGC